MVSFFWGASGFLFGWTICALILLIISEASTLGAARPAQWHEDVTPKWLKLLIAALVASVCLAIFVVAIGQSLQWAPSFSISSYAFKEHWVIMIWFSLFGFITRGYRNEVFFVVNKFCSYIFQGEKNAMVVQGVILIALIAFGVLVFDPKIFEKISSLKAGEVELHLKDGPSSIKPNISFPNLRRAVALGAWVRFAFNDDTQENGWRMRAGMLSKENGDRVDFGESLLRRQLKGLIVLGACYQEIGQTYKLRDDKDIIDFAGDYALLIKQSLSKKGNKEFGKDALYRLYRRSLRLQDKLFFDLLHSAQKPQCLDNYRVWEDDPESFKRIYADRPLEQLWEPYIISLVSDFVAFSESDREKADFLADVKAAGIENVCPAICDFQPTAMSNFYWYLVRSQIDSDQEWPLDEMLSETATMISWTNKYIDTEDMQIKARLAPKFKDENMRIDDIKSHYRLYKLQDLSLGLEVLYRKALSGTNMDDLQRSYWKRWLSQVCEALSDAENVGWEPSISEAERTGWRNARLIIEQRPDALFDAATAAAISTVMLPQQAATTPTEQDCLSARALLAYAKVTGTALTSAYSGSGTSKAKIDGFIEQIKARIEDACQ